MYKSIPRRRRLDGPSPAPVRGERLEPLGVRHPDVQRPERPALLIRGGVFLFICEVNFVP